jgi:hypothetical protein
MFMWVELTLLLRCILIGGVLCFVAEQLHAQA